MNAETKVTPKVKSIPKDAIHLSDGVIFFPRNAPKELKDYESAGRSMFRPALKDCVKRTAKKVPCCGKGNFRDVLLCNNDEIKRSACYDCIKREEPKTVKSNTEDSAE